MSELLLLDLDGTLLDTPHYEAWRNAAFKVQGIELSREDYSRHVAGRPRMEGASCVLNLKTVGQIEEHIQLLNVIELSECKQDEFLRLSANPRLFDDAIRLLKRVNDAGLTINFYTASQNAGELFNAALDQSFISVNQSVEVYQQSTDITRRELFQQLKGARRSEDVFLIDDSAYSADIASALGFQVWQIHRDQSDPKSSDPRVSRISSLDNFIPPEHRAKEK